MDVKIKGCSALSLAPEQPKPTRQDGHYNIAASSPSRNKTRKPADKGKIQQKLDFVYDGNHGLSNLHSGCPDAEKVPASCKTLIAKTLS